MRKIRHLLLVLPVLAALGCGKPYGEFYAHVRFEPPRKRSPRRG